MKQIQTLMVSFTKLGGEEIQNSQKGGFFSSIFPGTHPFLTKPHPFFYCSTNKRGVLLSPKNPPAWIGGGGAGEARIKYAEVRS